MDLAEKITFIWAAGMSEYNRGLLGLGGGMRSTEYHSSGVTSFLKRS